MEFDNIWTKLNLQWLRGNKEFKMLWRGLRVLITAALLGIAGDTANIMLGFGITQEMALAMAPFVEKWIRERIPATKV